ncbi:MAG: PH domain-containing protein [Rhodospirillales bacterium]|nr:PH domain-containing protein [Rhodospirillales bacterium]USO07517.1 MAG: PH domain-containing protein [Rhodospirillales bacterium]
MGYVDQGLANGEHVLYRARIALVSMIAGFMWLAIFVLGGLLFASIHGMENLAYIFLIAGLFAAAHIAMVYYGTELGVTSRRIVAKTGIIRRDTIDIALERVESIQIAQSPLGRLFNYGSVRITGTGTSHPMIHGIADPLAFRRAFADACERGNADAGKS